MFFAVGVVALGGVLITRKLKARRRMDGLMIDALVAPTSLSPSTPLPVSPPAPKRLIDLDSVTVEQHLLLSGSTLGLRIISIAGVPFLGPFSICSLLYLDLYFLRRAYAEWKTEGVNGVTDAVVATGLLITRQFGADALFATTYFVSRKLVQQTQTDLAQRLGGYTAPPPLLAVSATPLEHEAPVPEESASSAEDWKEPPHNQMGWQTVIRKSALPFVTLSALSLPFLGARRSLAVLLTNFGYDYRVTAPLSTLTYMDLAAQHEIVVGDWRAFEQLSQVDVVILDEQFFASPMTGEKLHGAPDQSPSDLRLLNQLQQAGRRTCVLIRKDEPPTLVTPANPASPETAHLWSTITTIAPDEVLPFIQQLHADQCTVCLVRSAPLSVADTPQADVVVTIRDPQTTTTSLEQWASERAHINLSAASPEQLFTLFQLADHLAYNLKRGLALTLFPSIVSLGGIYLFHFGAFRALLLESSALAAGVLNAQWPRLGNRSTPPTQRALADTGGRDECE